MAAEELADLERLDVKLKAMKAELKTAVAATGSRLMDIHGIGPAGAARILADVGDVTRFPNRNHFASWTGTAPVDASSGEHIRHRLSRAGNRRLNHVLYMAGIVQLRHDTPAAPTTSASWPPGKPRWKRCAACAAGCPMPSTASSPPTPRPSKTRAREGTPGRLCCPARPTFPGHRHFGPATSRTRAPHTSYDASSRENPAAPHSCPPRRRAGGVNVQRPQRPSARTNDVDTDQRRRSLDSAGPPS